MSSSSGIRSYRLRPWRLLAVVSALLAFTTACDPVTHPRHEVVDTSTKLFVQGFSGDGNVVVASATVATTVVGGPGLWRIDRRDGSTTALPTGSKFEAINRDGTRIRLGVPNAGGIYHSVVWDNGVLKVPPAVGGVESSPVGMSPDLQFGIMRVGWFQQLPRLWDVTTGTLTTIEEAGGLQAGQTVDARVLDVANGGTRVWYRVHGSGGSCELHFVDVTSGATDVVPGCDEVTVGASGRYLLKGLDPLSVIDLGGNELGGPTRLELYATNAPTVLLDSASVLDPTDSVFREIHLADDAPVFWAAEVTGSGNVTDPCGTPTTPACNYHEETLALLVGTAGGPIGSGSVERIAVDPNLSTLYVDEPPRTAMTPDGRFLAYADSDGTYRVRDRMEFRTEVLDDPLDSKAVPLLSDDGRILLTSRATSPGQGTGWWEFLAADACSFGGCVQAQRR